MDSSYSGSRGLHEIPPPPWTDELPAEFRYTYDVLERALPEVHAEGLRFYITKEAYFVPEYGPNVVPILLQEERCKVPVYGRHVRAVIRNLLSKPFLGFNPRAGFGRLEAVLTFEYLRDCYTSLRSRYFLAHPPASFPEMVRREPRTIYMPLGYHSQIEVPQIPMAERPLDTFFAGQISHPFHWKSYKRYTSTSKVVTRKQLWAELLKLQKQGKWAIDRDIIAANENKTNAAFGSYSLKMMQSRICVSPRGTMADTYRTYEGLRAGCLTVCNPLAPDKFMYPGAPLLILDRWSELEGVMKRYARNIDALEEWRARGLAWYHNHLRPEVLAASVAEQLNEAGDSMLQ